MINPLLTPALKTLAVLFLMGVSAMGGYEYCAKKAQQEQQKINEAHLIERVNAELHHNEILQKMADAVRERQQQNQRISLDLIESRQQNQQNQQILEKAIEKANQNNQCRHAFTRDGLQLYRQALGYDQNR